MKNKLFSILLVLSVLLSNMAVVSADAGFEGEGTEESPYLINTAEDLVNLTNLTNAAATAAEYADKYYKVTADIDMAGVSYKPISYATSMSSVQGKAFSGTLDGDGHVIRNITFAGIATYGATYGIVGYLGADGTVKNLGVENISVNGGNSGRLCIGGIAGSINSGITIESCYVRGMSVNTTSTDATYTGGIVGRTIGNGGEINNCYTADLSFSLGNANYSGGIIGGCGNTAYKAQNCYTIYSKSQGWAAATNSYMGTVNCYILSTIESATASVLGEAFKENPTLKNDGYPLLAWESTEGWELKDDEEEEADDPYFVGKGTEEEPFEIDTAEKLSILAQLTNTAETIKYASKYYKLTENIDMSGISYKPVSYATNMSAAQGATFTGVFDGNNHVIRNISFASIATYGATYGIIGHLGAGGVVKNLGVENMTISGLTSSRLCIGGIAGSINSSVTIENCYVRDMTVSVTPSGTDTTTYVGGIAGRTLGVDGLIKNCYATSLSFGGVTNANTRAGILGSSGNTGYKAEYCYTTEAKIQGNASATNSYMGTTNCYSSTTIANATVENLGDAFDEDADELNGGMPVLAWEYDIAHPETVYYTVKSGDVEIEDGDTGISVKNPVVVAFGKEMNIDTFSKIQIFMGDTQLNDCVFDAESAVLTIKINAEYNTEYTIIIPKTVQSVKDEDGKSAKADEKKITFRTEAMPKAVTVENVKINGAQNTPSNLSPGDEVVVEAEVENSGELSAQPVAMVVTVFDREGIMRYAALDTAVIKDANETLTVRFTVPEKAGENPVINVMVWDSITKMNAMR